MIGAGMQSDEAGHLLEREPLALTLGRQAPLGQHARCSIGGHLQRARDSAGPIDPSGSPVSRLISP